MEGVWEGIGTSRAAGVFEVLVEQGASLTATNTDGQTAKDWASDEGHTYVVAYLESAGG